MDFDLKKIIEQVTEKVKGDDKLMEKFKADPIKTIEGIVGVDLPDDKMQGVVDAVKGKLLGEKDEGILGKIGNLFGKK